MKFGNLDIALRSILEERIITEKPRVGSFSWMFIYESVPLDNGLTFYKLGKTARVDSYILQLNKQPFFSKEKKPLITEIRGGSTYFIKVVRRIFKSKKRSLSVGGNDWFSFDQEDIKWISQFKIADAYGLERDVFNLFENDPDTQISNLRKEGLWPNKF